MRRSAELEMMDLPGHPRELLTGDLRNLRLINRYLGCHRTVLRGLARLVSTNKLRAFTLLDVGTGSADIPEIILAQTAGPPRSRDLPARAVVPEGRGVTAGNWVDGKPGWKRRTQLYL